MTLLVSSSMFFFYFFFFKQKTAYEMRISDWSSDVCSSDLKLGRLDILVNNAGEQHPAADIRDIDEDQLQRTFATNIFGMFYLVQAALTHLKKGWAIVNFTRVPMYEGLKEVID